MVLQNQLREALEHGDYRLGAKCSTYSQTAIEFYGELGLDFVWLDLEHGGPSPWDGRVLEAFSRAAEVSGIELLVRIPSADPALVRKVLDTGVRTILVPRVDDAEAVRSVVEASRFEYEGRPGQRGRSGARAARWGTRADYPETDDQSVLVGVMIEKTTAVENLDDILSVPGLGFVFIGPSDLAVQMGYPSDTAEQAVVDRVEDIRQRSVEAGVPVGRIANDPDEAIAAVEHGVQLIRIGGAFEAARSALTDRAEQISTGVSR